ncbi:YceI family protein [Tunturiibacter gelidoferens]|jgi:polyisoprenoid-binding protein YceI|uniref:Polyisoprenoid-binding protein YceI n=1 Tax=Tunturiibacter gelidiferens TaxID=3069689 RepID=A0A9X0QAI4_9BACT|nr:YceI family protein [Edaphobacter lichenicola]MBB5326807.1 polyisoprenoid-binding protein YceI [Edaphobacter lichenicola]
MNRRIFTAALSALLLTGVSAFAQSSTWTIDPNHSQVNFAIKHLQVSTVRGSISGITGNVNWDDKDPSKSSVEATINTTTLTTNNEKRDAHLKSPDFFNVEKFPTMTFKSTAVTGAPGKLQVVGDLTLAGVTKSVTLDVDGPTPPQKGMGGKLVTGFSATGKLKRSDFNFGSKFGEPMLGDEVQFTIDVEAGK